ncbi:hypothetical protein [uncultured Aeromicrobium sp.]|uniref:hypothetical protein n=1 Tax=uncultured Aeromicrobium sp. TaxID=337820 RepID=UPI0025DD6070|nr:hypothetical protein [uncultured Aeromicrobium sp.]
MTNAEEPLSGPDHPDPNPSPEPVDDAKRRANLAQAIAVHVAQGRRVESQSDFQAVLVQGKPINHTLHLILTIVTCSLWGLVWAGLAIFGGEKRIVLTVDAYGNVLNYT